MKVLMTGFTSTQVHGRFARYDRPSFVSAIKNGLQASGHNVDLRAVKVGEDLREYDSLVLGLFDAGSLGSMVYKWGAIWSALNFIGRTAFMVEDSEFHLIFGNLYRIWRTAYGARGEEMTLLKAVAEDKVDEMVNGWEEQLPGPTILPAFKWGMDSLFPHSVESLHRFDMSWMLPNYHSNVMGPKTRQWAIASCHPMDNFVVDLNRRRHPNASPWPIIQQCKPDGERWTPMNESQVVKEIYAPSWGILNRPYRYSGLGRFRAVYPYAEMVSSILYNPNGESHPDPAYNLSFEAIEGMSDIELVNAMLAQRAAYEKYKQPKDEFVAGLDQIVRGLE